MERGETERDLERDGRRIKERDRDIYIAAWGRWGQIGRHEERDGRGRGKGRDRERDKRKGRETESGRRGRRERAKWESGRE